MGAHFRLLQPFLVGAGPLPVSVLRSYLVSRPFLMDVDESLDALPAIPIESINPIDSIGIHGETGENLRPEGLPGKDYRSRGGSKLTTQQTVPGIFATTS